MGINELDFFKSVVESFTCTEDINESIDAKNRFTFLINSPSFEKFDRVDQIANAIYELSDENFENLTNFFGFHLTNGDSAFNVFALNVESTLGIQLNQKNLRKFEEHIKLSCHQRRFIIKNVIEAKTIADDAKKVAEKAEEIKTKIYSEFIGILAIFTALTFSMMGSLQLLGNVFNDVKNLENKSIGYALLISSVYLLVIYLLIIIMFVGMKKVIGHDKPYQFTPSVTIIVILTILLLFLLGLGFSGLLPIT